MQRTTRPRFVNTTAIAAVLSLGTVSIAHAVDGVVEINHISALVGNVTPGDLPGYPVSIKVAGSYRLTSSW